MPVEPVKEKKSTEKNSGNRIRLADTVKAVPNDLARNVLSNGARRAASRLRDTAQRDQRSDYGGDQVEDAAQSGAYLAARSADAVVRGGIRNIMRGRRSETPPPDDMPPLRDPPPMYDAPEFLPELDGNQSAIGELPPAESPTFPEHPAPLGETPVQETFSLPKRSEIASNAKNAIHPERTVFSGETQVPTEKSALFSENPTAFEDLPQRPESLYRPETGSKIIPTTEPSVSETPSEAAERLPNRRASHSEPEPILTELKEESWRPAYRDAEPPRSWRPAYRDTEPPRRMSVENGTDAVRENGERIKIKNSDSVFTRKPERAIETPDAGRDFATSGRRVSVKEKNVTADAERSQNIETGRPPIREKNRTEVVRLAESRAPENPSSVREKSRTFPDVAESGHGNEQRVSQDGDGHRVSRTREQSAGRIPDTISTNAKPSEKSGLSVPSGSEKIGINTGDVSEHRTEFSVRPSQNVENHVQNVKSDGQIGVRERIARIRTAENCPSGNVRNREAVTRGGNGSERTPVKIENAPGYRTGTSNAETPVQTAGGQKAVRERLGRVSGRSPEVVTGANRIELTWKSSNPEVATVKNGVVTGVSLGEAIITVSDNGVNKCSAQTHVTVTELMEYATISDFKNLDTAAEGVLKLDNALVLFVDNDDAYVRDASGAICFTQTGLNFKAGDQLNGAIYGSFDVYANVPYFLAVEHKTNSSGYSVKSNQTVTPISLNPSELTDDYYANLITLKAVKLQSTTYNGVKGVFAQCGDRMVRVFNTFGVKAPARMPAAGYDGKFFDVTGILITRTSGSNVVDELAILNSPVEVEAPAGIATVVLDADAPVTVFTVDGRQVAETTASQLSQLGLGRGLYIVKSGQRASKHFVK